MKRKIRWLLLTYDTVIYLACAVFILMIFPSLIGNVPFDIVLMHILLAWVCLFISRMCWKVYQQIWRYAGPGEYLRLLLADFIACIVYIPLRHLFFGNVTFTYVRIICLFTVSLLGCIAVRHLYQWIYLHRNTDRRIDKLARILLKIFTNTSFDIDEFSHNRIRVAIVGAGSVGVALSDELINNPKAIYEPILFVDIDKKKVGRDIGRIPVFPADENIGQILKKYHIQEVVFALPNMSADKKMELYSLYKDAGYKIKSYDYPTLESDENSKRTIHDFNIEDLLFREANQFLSEETMDWYRGKSVLITGGGGSIGSELARQIAKCGPSRLVILDAYENGAYDVQQELRTKYGDGLNLRIEIASICDRDQIDKLFREHTPDIVLHAAAHKHVPLMERNVIEAVTNNVFGTLNIVETCEKYGVKRFIMISTDKAVNPTNVMGATKRMCEMIVQSRDESKTSFSATRFGNVLGSNGSVIPLFKRQIENGGPVTVTDKRIIRYFMTIPEASQLVMTSGAMAKNGELYVLDMGNPVKIIDLAENMIRLSGYEPYTEIPIVEIGLRPGEKLYEELLVKSEELDTTDNKKIFKERDKPLGKEEIEKKLKVLEEALKTGSNRVVKQALMDVVPTYHSPEEVNNEAINAEEMQRVAGV